MKVRGTRSLEWTRRAVDYSRYSVLIRWSTWILLEECGGEGEQLGRVKIVQAV